MIVERGVITKVEAEGVWVKSQQVSACNACRAKSGCGQKLINKWSSEEFDLFARYTPTSKTSHYSVGDLVEVAIAEGAILYGSALLYGLPVLVIVLLALLIGHIQSADLTLAVPLTLSFLAMVFLLYRRLLRRKESESLFHPQLVGLAPLTGDPVT